MRLYIDILDAEKFFGACGAMQIDLPRASPDGRWYFLVWEDDVEALMERLVYGGAIEHLHYTTELSRHEIVTL